MNWRLGIDLGETSLGWCGFILDPEKNEPIQLLDAGVRIFTSGRDPKTREPLAVSRRLARQRRRQLDRRMKRQRNTVKFLISTGLLPKSEEERKKVFLQDPYECRAKAALGTAMLFEVGRALVHLAKRRGFRSSRKDITDEEKTGGGLREAMSKLKSELGNQTLGQLLHQWNNRKGRSVRFRKGAEYYPERWMYQKEFEAIRKVNENLLTGEQWAQLKDRLIFFQRKLRPVERGKCAIRPELERAPACLPSFELFRIWENVNNLRWVDEAGEEHKLTDPQRHQFAQQLQKKKSIKFSVLGKKLENFKYFKQETEARTTLEGCPITVEFKDAEIPGWDTMSLEQRDNVVALLLDLDNDLRAKPIAKRLGLDLNYSEDFYVRLQSIASSWGIDVNVLAKLSKKADQVRTTSSYCPELLREVIPIMAVKGCTHRVAIENELGYALPQDEFDGTADLLPYYGKVLRRSCLFADPSADSETDPEKHYGKIGNPTVHVALNQLQVIVNALSQKYGKPNQIAIELARDLKNSRKKREDIQERQREDKKQNDHIKSKLQENNLTINATNILKMKLWEELGEESVERRCVFSGKQISFCKLFSPNSEIEIEHILPFSRTYDDSINNKTLAYKSANSLKGNRSPFEAFGDNRHEDKGYIWEEILRRSQRLPPAKRHKFEPKVMESLTEDEWLGRQLNDTAYITKQAALYLRAICKNVWTIPGRLTGFLRRQWDLLPLLSEDQQKNRDDHRHHSVDAFVVGLTSRSLFNYISRASKYGRPLAKELLDRHKSQGELPLADLRDDFANKLDKMIISFKPDHNVNQRFIKETAYGRVLDNSQKSSLNLVTRIPIEALDKNINIRGLQYQSIIETSTSTLELKEKLSEQGVRRVRTKKSDSSIISFPSTPYKAYALDGYAWCDVWQLNDSKKTIVSVFVSYWEALQVETGKISVNELRPKGAAEAKRLMRLRKNDIFTLEHDPMVYRVIKFGASADRLQIGPHHLLANDNKLCCYRSLNVLVKQGIKKLSISPIGGVGKDASYRRNRQPRSVTT